MKKLLLLIISLLISPSIFPQQYYYTFSELKGMEDNSGNTHLFYRLYYYSNHNGNVIKENSIYHLDLSNNADSLFLFDGGTDYVFSSPSFRVILDYEFWNNDPAKYIFVGVGISVDPVTFIQRFDEGNPSYSNLGDFINGNIEISRQNDSLIFMSPLKSTNGGRSWNVDSSLIGGQLISLSPFYDSVLFFQNGNELLKSTDQGSNFSVVDTFRTDIEQFFYDEDENHIYRIINNGDENFLSVSDNKGNAFSWTQEYSSANKILISIDYSQSGSIYLSDGNYIYHSNNYGDNFSLFRKLERKIVGIYKKPNSDKLYAATKYYLYEITSDTIITLKHLQIDPDIFSWFPLHVGDKWVYHEVINQFDPFITDTEKDWIKEITGKVIKENGKEYFEYIYTNYSPYYDIDNFERIDTSSGKVFRYNTFYYPGTEYEGIDLLSEIGDTVNSYFYGRAVLNYEDDLIMWDTSSHYKHFSEFESLAGYNYNLVLNFGIDSIRYGFDFGSSISYLKGAIINGVVYGDTRITDIEEPNNIPKSFSLSQNYPNPFNPSTIISWQLPVRSNVSLKVYDILGNEVAVLVDKYQLSGNYEIEFKADDLSSGIYFYKLSTAGEAGNFSKTKKMILLR